MFGYVTPCKMELKIKDYEKFKAYYCGLCKAIKINFGNLPRLALNYDMTFLAVLIDSLDASKGTFETRRCMMHPAKKRLMLINNAALNYAAFCNVILAYYKLIDDVQDEKSKLSLLLSKFLKGYIRKVPSDQKSNMIYIEHKLKELTLLENNMNTSNLDELSHPFADVTGFIICSYFEKEDFKDDVYWLGYNLGKWIYIIDALDDLEKDMKNNKFNALHSCYNAENKAFDELFALIEQRADFILVTCAQNCLHYLNKLPLKKNHELLENILQYGLMEKMDKVFKRSEYNNEKSI